MSTTPTIQQPTTRPLVYDRERDKYGRSCHRAIGVNMRTAGFIVRLPKAYIAKHGPDRTYLVNHWDNPDRDAAVTYHRTLAAAKAHLEAEARKFPR